MRRTSVLLAVYTGILTVGLLAPLDLYTGNGAQWARGADAVVFDSPGILRARRTPHRLYEDLMSGTGFAAAVRVMSHSVEQGGPARIVSYSADTGARNFTIAQDGSALVVRLRSSETDDNGMPQFEVPDVFTAGEWRDIVVTYDFRHLCTYVDGRRRACRSSPAGDFSNWDRSHELSIGNEATAQRPWRGAISHVAVYNRALSAEDLAHSRERAGGVSGSSPSRRHGLVALYSFTERSGRIVGNSVPTGVSLTMPEVLEQRRPFLRRDLALATRPLRGYVLLDVVVNSLMFAPFALLACLVLNARRWPPTGALIAAIAATAVFSLGVESAQYFMVTRSSELQDLMLNVLSGAIGGVAYLVGRRRSGQSSP